MGYKRHRRYVTKMKCLSLNQPFADLIVDGKKTIELRRWKTKFRGTFLVHASKKVLSDEARRLGFDPKSFVTGAIIGKATIYGIKEYDVLSPEWKADADKHFADVNFASSINGFLVKDAVRFDKPIPFAGQLNFFEVDYDEQNHIAKQHIKDEQKTLEAERL